MLPRRSSALCLDLYREVFEIHLVSNRVSVVLPLEDRQVSRLMVFHDVSMGVSLADPDVLLSPV